MKYKFRKVNFWEELQVAIGDIPCNITDSGDEMLFEFGELELSAAQEKALAKLMAEKPMLRGKLAKFVGKGLDIEVTPPVE